ncbi:hypothetical protein CDD81_6311 [Ophiocordyceps australis]|uniref:HIG1 domain-containing protein n=1 Tax=Ophiocordyceps australis TaxID=1399860 RepID=A0A2C5Y5U5_9HYPO|nr:hypothetical protein CDD81_6311 [Ophiocordyceps australis]
MASRLPPPPPPPPDLAPMPSSFDGNDDFYNERPLQKMLRKLKEEPLIPLGAGLTVAAFINSWRAVRRGDSHQANRMFRARVAAQAFTIIAMVAGSMYYSRDREKTKELRRLKDLRDAEEKRLRWIRELEARDEEEKAFRARMDRRRAQGAAADDAPSEGGILGKMGLWKNGEQTSSTGQDEHVEAAAAVADKPVENDGEREQKPSRRHNPKSSLDAISGVILSQKKDGKHSSKDDKSEK